MPELKALARESGLRGYSRLRKAELIAFLQNNEHQAQKQQRPPKLSRDSKFVFDGVIRMDIDFHRLNLTRGSSYIPLPDWLAKKVAIINPKNSDMECFKWAVIAAMKWKDIDNHPERISKLRRLFL